MADVVPDPETLGEAYAASLAEPWRRWHGVHYTPRSLADLLIPPALEPLVFEGCREGWPPVQWQRRSVEAILALRLCDPACGAGALLFAAARYLAEQIVTLWNAPERRLEALRLVVRQCLLGIDNDASAIAVCRQAFQRLTQTSLAPQLHVGDALDLRSPSETFPQSKWDLPAGFDAMLCNPPFRNAIEGAGADVPLGLRPRLRHGTCLGGTADLAYYFLEQMHRLTRPDGTIGVILPRVFLSARSARRLRQQLQQQRPVRWLYAPEAGNLFASARVRVALAVFGGSPPAVAGTEPPAAVAGTELPLRPTVFDRSNWWECLRTALPELASPATRWTLGHGFDVQAGMTAHLAYLLLPFLQEADPSDADRDANLGADADANLGAVEPSARRGLRFVTAGLIDRNMCLWGQRKCRYLRRHYQRPIVRDSSAMPEELRRRLRLARRPKVLLAAVAGPGERLEAFLDPIGRYCGAVSTWMIFHPADDLSALRQVCDLLHAEATTHRVSRELAGAALGDGLLTIPKAFVRSLPWPGLPVRCP